MKKFKKLFPSRAAMLLLMTMLTSIGTWAAPAPPQFPTTSGGSGTSEDPYKIMHKMRIHSGHQGMVLRVYDDCMVFERRDFEDLGLLGDDWVVPLPSAVPMPFAYAKRAAASDLYFTPVPPFTNGSIEMPPRAANLPITSMYLGLSSFKRSS